MPIITDFLPNFFKKQKFRKMSQPQVEGLLDTIVFTMVSDGRVTPTEREELARAADLLPWQAPHSIASYISDAEDRLKGSPSPPDFLARAADVLDEEWMQEDAYYLCARMAGADNAIVEAETEFLHALTTALGLGGERLRIITRRLIDEDHV